VHVPTGKSFLGDLADGWRLALGNPIILPLLLIVGLVSLTLNPYSILMPAIAVGTFGRGAELHGLFVSALGIGALTLAIVLARRPNVRGLARWVLFTATTGALGAISFSLAALYKNLPLAIFAMMLVGAGLMGTSACVNTIIQTVVDDDKRGRVVSVYSTFFTGAAPLGHLGVGWLASQIGAPYAFMACGGVCALGAIAYAINLQHLRRHLIAAYTERGIIEAKNE
jgi:MFS family permease